MATNTIEKQTVEKSKLMIEPSPHIKDSISTQKIMLTVSAALLPAVLASIYYFGFRALILTVVSVVSCVLFEYLFAIVTKQKSTISDCSAIVTGIILACNVPVTLPLWIMVFGAFLAIVVIKGLFGGIGCNFANPAATSRVFLLVSFASHMTTWVAPLHGASAVTSETVIPVMGVDMVATATPLSGHMEEMPSLLQMFLGARGGSLGETCALALLLGGLFLIYKGIISWIIPVTTLGSIFVFALVFGANPFYAVLSGGAMIGAFFMATDYSTCPVTDKGKAIFGIGIGFITMVIRSFCSYPEGMSYAILLMNILTPHIDNLTVTKPFGAVFAQKAK